MRHSLDNCLPILRRWGSLSEYPLPDDWSGFCDRYPTESFRIRERDPELVSLLAGEANANLRADALSGKLSETIPSLEEQAESQRQQQVEELTQGGAYNPFGAKGYYNDQEQFVEPVKGNLTQQMMLETLDPELAAKLKGQAATPTAAHGWSEREVAILGSHGYSVPTN